MSIFAHLTRNIYRKFLKLGAQIRQRMEEKAKSLKKACYELDTDFNGERGKIHQKGRS